MKGDDIMYKINLDDNSFIIADDNYKLTIFRFGIKRHISVKDYLYLKNSSKYYLVDKINGKKYKRLFTVEFIDSSPFAVGSRIKLAKDIKTDDLVIGKDGTPRRVKELHSGEEDMYEISVNNTTYTVNGGHILALVDRETGEHLEIPVNVFMHMNDEFKSHYVMEKI